MEMKGNVALVTGGASGLGLASVEKMLSQGAKVVILDLPSSRGAEIAAEKGGAVRFIPADVRDAGEVQAAIDAATEMGTLRACIHCAGRGGPVRVVDKEGNPGSLETYQEVVNINLVGSFNVLRLAAAAMAKNDEVEGERGVIILTASVAAFEGQIGQIPYASAKAGIHGMTIVAARDLASRKIRVCTIAPGTFSTPILDRVKPEVKEALEKATPHPSRLGRPEEYAKLAASIIDNAMINGETIRIDGAIRMAPR